MVDHEQVQAAVSARLDGEPTGLDDDVIDAHLAGCAECRRFAEQAARMSGSLRYVEPRDDGMSPPHDLSETILAQVEPEWRRRDSNRRAGLAIGRVVLTVLALLHGVWAVGTLISTGGLAPVSSDGTVLAPAAEPELMRLLVESAGLRFALAVALAFGAWKPGLIAGIAIIPATLTAFLIGFTARDLVLGTVGTPQLALLALLVVTVLALAGTWLADRGVALKRAWRTLGADPR